MTDATTWMTPKRETALAIKAIRNFDRNFEPSQETNTQVRQLLEIYTLTGRYLDSNEKFNRIAALLRYMKYPEENKEYSPESKRIRDILGID
jgi:hypothetical protein